MGRDVEKSNALIQLAQIIMILSGFLFASWSIAYTNSVNTLSSSVSIINDLYFESIKIENKTLFNTYPSELIKTYLNTVMLHLKLANLFFLFGIIGTFVSFLVWWGGYEKINKDEISK